MDDSEVIARLTNMGINIANQIERGQAPSYELPVRTLSNVYFDEESKTIKLGDKVSKRQFMNIAHTRKFMQTILVASEIKKLIEEGVNVSIRDLYYALKHTIGDTKENTFEGQQESDPVIVDLEASLDVLRENLHLGASAKGLVAGDMKIVDGDDTIDCSKMGSSGWAVPSNVEPEKIEIKETGADYILFIEKEAVWRRFNEDKFWKKNNCIVMTGRGQPARGERRFAQRLHKEYNLPVYALMDADPYGMYIYSVIKQGSIALSYSEEKLSTPATKYIGLTITDAATFDLKKDVQIKLADVDKKRIKEMKAYKWFSNKKWQEELTLMEEKGFKMELEALSSKYYRFITEEYVPQKIESQDFLP